MYHHFEGRFIACNPNSADPRLTNKDWDELIDDQPLFQERLQRALNHIELASTYQRWLELRERYGTPNLGCERA